MATIDINSPIDDPNDPNQQPQSGTGGATLSGGANTPNTPNTPTSPTSSKSGSGFVNLQEIMGANVGAGEKAKSNIEGDVNKATGLASQVTDATNKVNNIQFDNSLTKNFKNDYESGNLANNIGGYEKAMQQTAGSNTFNDLGSMDALRQQQARFQSLGTLGGARTQGSQALDATIFGSTGLGGDYLKTNQDKINTAIKSVDDNKLGFGSAVAGANARMQAGKDELSGLAQGEYNYQQQGLDRNAAEDKAYNTEKTAWDNDPQRKVDDMKINSVNDQINAREAVVRQGSQDPNWINNDPILKQLRSTVKTLNDLRSTKNAQFQPKIDAYNQRQSGSAEGRRQQELLARLLGK